MGMLKPFRWYEVQDKQRMAHIRDTTIPAPLAEFKKWFAEKCPPDNPDSAKVVIISSYETFNQRALEVTAAVGP